MDMLKQLNAAMTYIEANLGAEVDLDAAAALACISTDSFVRFFSYMTSMTLTEYIRRRRLTLAAEDLRHSNAPIVDIAVAWGYDSAAAFSRAFAKQHGMTPSAYRREGGPLRVYPPATFHITIKGAKEMELRMIELEEKTVWGLSRPYEGAGYADQEELRHQMWAHDIEDVPGRLCEGRWNQAGSTAYDGVWYGVWQNGRYAIARDKEDTTAEGLEPVVLPAGTYAAFTSAKGGFAGEEIPRLFELIFESWLPSSGYRMAGGTVIEVYHLWTGKEMRKQNRYYEVWVPVERDEK